MTASCSAESPASPSSSCPPGPTLAAGRSAPLAAIEVRPAVAADLPAILAIYAHHVQHGLATFEEVVPALHEFTRRWQSVADAGLPWLVALDTRDTAPEILGYAYAAQYRPRSAYRFTLEDSVYVRAGLAGRGVGKALLTELLARCEAGPWRQMVAVIGDSANAASIGLHRTMGFADAGVQRAVGFKFGRWVDTVQMQRPLGAGASLLP